MFDSKSKFYLDEQLVYYLVKHVDLDKHPIVNYLNILHQTVNKNACLVKCCLLDKAAADTAAAQILLHRRILSLHWRVTILLIC